MADIGGVDAAAGQRAEHRRAGTRREGSPAVKPAGQQRGGLLVDADRPGLIALAVAHPERPGLEVQVALLERERFGDAQARSPQYGD